MRHGVKTVLLGLLLALPAWAQVQTAPSDAPWFNPALPVNQRASALIAQMTVEEKASQLVNQARAIPRLGVPAYNWWNEALHGVARNGYATVFPEPVGLAATFDTPLVYEMATAVSTEARVKYNMALHGGGVGIYQGLTFWSPNINIFRDPRWGRGQETYGEDPFLTGQFAIAFITGMQGDDPAHPRVVATAKHFAVHSGPEATRHAVDVPASKHDMEDTYLPAFRNAMVDARADSLMCAYNRINGQPACASDFLLNDTLRGAWGFKGYVVSDCDAILDIQRGHKFTDTVAQAAAVSLAHGVDNDCADFSAPTLTSADYDRYTDAQKQNLVPQAVVDASLQRLFSARIALGMFDPPGSGPYGAIPDSELDSPAHRALALKAARESMVLLKNNGLLPLKRTVKRIAVIGPLADEIAVLEGNYNGTPTRAVTALDGIRAAFPGAKVTFAPGTTRFLRDGQPIPASVLRTEDGQAGLKPGLKAEIWRGADFADAPAISRTDAMVNYTREMPKVLPDAPLISARWSGYLVPDESGLYNVAVEGGKMKTWIDDKLVFQDDQSTPRQPKTVEMQLEKGRRYAIRIEQNPGTGPIIALRWTRIDADALAHAVDAAKQADVVIAVVGITSALESEETQIDIPGFKGGDRTSMDLPAEEQAILEAVRKTGKKMAVVLMNGSALSVNWAAKNADAILEAWYSGEEGGTAIGQTLSGDNNPAGRLPVTFYKSVDDLPSFDDYSMKNRTYRYFTGKPLYAFGHGLSYTRFAYSSLKLSPASLQAGGNLGVDVMVKNTGRRAGDEVAQLYLSFPPAPGMPLRALRGFQRVALKAGTRRTLHFDLSPRDLSSVTAAGDRIVAPGAYRLSIGGGQPGPGVAAAQGGFRVTGQATLPR
jgi:beta-glucosidase